MLLFGSRARGEARPDSDFDLFLESLEELDLLPPELLAANGGPVDAFWLPGADGWAMAVGDEERMLVCWDRFGSRVDPLVPITPAAFMTLLQVVKGVSMRYIVYDLYAAECNLEPLICLRCGADEVAFSQAVSDGYCQCCGVWQTELRSTRAHLELGLLAGSQGFGALAVQSHDGLSAEAAALLSNYVGLAQERVGDGRSATMEAALKLVMGYEVWGWDRWQHTHWCTQDGAKIYIGHFRQDHDPHHWTITRVRFVARRPVIALRTITGSGCNPADFAGMRIN